MERTYVMLKADAYQRGLIGKIINRIEEKKYQITNMKMILLDEEILKDHYSHHANQPYFPRILEYMTAAPSVAMIIEGEGVIDGMIEMVGTTKCFEAMPGTIRRDYAVTDYENLIHRSDSKESAEIEIKRFFGEL